MRTNRHPSDYQQRPPTSGELLTSLEYIATHGTPEQQAEAKALIDARHTHRGAEIARKCGVEVDDTAFIVCPRCGADIEDFDGFTVTYCPKCGFCTHPSYTDGICDICGAAEPNECACVLPDQSCPACRAAATARLDKNEIPY